MINKLLNVKDFYLAYWVQVPGRERLVLARYLRRIHDLLCDSPMTQESLVVVAGDNSFHALTPAQVYQRLGQFTAGFENDAASTGSEEDENYIERLWEMANRAVSKVRERIAYSVVGRDRTKKILKIVEEWIGKIDDIIAYRVTLILLKKNTTSGIFSQHVQRFDLPNTRNQMGLLLTKLPLIVEDDINLDVG